MNTFHLGALVLKIVEAGFSLPRGSKSINKTCAEYVEFAEIKTSFVNFHYQTHATVRKCESPEQKLKEQAQNNKFYRKFVLLGKVCYDE